MPPAVKQLNLRRFRRQNSVSDSIANSNKQLLIQKIKNILSFALL